MFQTKIIESNSYSNFEIKLNRALVEIQSYTFVDIKYSTTVKDSYVIFSAIVIYKVVDSLGGTIESSNF